MSVRTSIENINEMSEMPKITSNLLPTYFAKDEGQKYRNQNNKT